MTTKKEFIEWLDQFPDNTLIEVKDVDLELPEIKGNDEFSKSIWGSNDMVDITDFRYNKFTDLSQPWHGKVVINFGGE